MGAEGRKRLKIGKNELKISENERKWSKVNGINRFFVGCVYKKFEDVLYVLKMVKMC